MVVEVDHAHRFGGRADQGGGDMVVVAGTIEGGQRPVPGRRGQAPKLLFQRAHAAPARPQAQRKLPGPQVDVLRASPGNGIGHAGLGRQGPVNIQDTKTQPASSRGEGP